MRFKRQEYLDLMLGNRTDRQFFVELFGPLIGLDKEWQEQGAAPDELDMTAFDWDYVDYTNCGVNALVFGQVCQPHILEETDEYLVSIDKLGRKNKLCKQSSTLPLPLDWPVQTMEDWKKIKYLFEYHPGRINETEIQKAANLQKNSDYVITASILGAYDTLRLLMGDEQACIIYYTDPELARDILDTLTKMSLRVFEQTLDKIHVDQLLVHEDMAGKSGPLVGPKQIETYYKPCYRAVWDLFKSHNTPIFQMDSDGNVNPIIDALLDCGLNCLYPMEPAAGMDVVAVRKKYGQRLMMCGGIDKHVLRESKEAIRAELEYKMQPLMQTGGMIFGLDHRIPNGTPLENYRYYVNLGRELLGREPLNPKSKGWRRMAFCS